MDWIFEHIWVLIAVASVIARLLMKRKQGEAGESTQPPPKEYEFEDPELAERTRKIREEIQRKIAERRGQLSQPPVLQQAQPRPAPIQRSPEATTPPMSPVNTLLEALKSKLEPVQPPSRRIAAERTAEENERQMSLLERLKEAELMKTTSQRRVAFEASLVDKESVALQQARAVLLDDLRSPQALRRAFVLREMLGPPVALR